MRISVPFILLQATQFHFSLWLSNTPLCSCRVSGLFLKLGCCYFQSSTIVNKHGFVSGSIVSWLTFLVVSSHSSGITRSYGWSIFSVLRHLHAGFHSDCTNVHSQQHIRILFSLHPHQHLLLFVLLIMAILTGVRWNLHVVLSCVSFMAKDFEHFFMHLWPFVPLFRIVCSVHLPTYLFNELLILCRVHKWRR
jgi:hypothetical protein